MPRDIFAVDKGGLDDAYTAATTSCSSGSDSGRSKREFDGTTSGRSSTSSSETTVNFRGRPRRTPTARSFNFTTSTRDIRTPPPPATPLLLPSVLSKYRKHNVFPLGWLLGSVFRDMYTTLSQWILDGLSAWFLRRSFLGNFRHQVFRDIRHRLKTSPLSVFAPPKPINQLCANSSEATLRKKIVNVPKALEESESTLAEVDKEERLVDLQVTESKVPEGSSNTVQWIIFVIEVIALIPIVVIGLSLFYILAVGIYNDVQDLLQRLLGDEEKKEAGVN